MRSLILIMACCLGTWAYGQYEPKVSDELLLQQPTTYDFQHLDFPQANILVKRAVVPDYNSLAGITVVISEIDHDAGKVILKRADGKNFFRYYPEVSADLAQALEAGELKIL